MTQSTDQKVGGLSPSERASPEATSDHEVASTIANAVAKAAHVTLRTAAVELDAGGRVPVAGSDDPVTGLNLAAVYCRRVCSCRVRAGCPGHPIVTCALAQRSPVGGDMR